MVSVNVSSSFLRYQELVYFAHFWGKISQSSTKITGFCLKMDSSFKILDTNQINGKHNHINSNSTLLQQSNKLSCIF